MTWLSWALLSALFAGLTAVLAKAGVRNVDSNLATAIRTAVILVFAWAVVLFNGFGGFGKVSNRAWAFLILSGLTTGASWLCYFRALQLGEASKVAPVDKTECRGCDDPGGDLSARVSRLAPRHRGCVDRRGRDCYFPGLT